MHRSFKADCPWKMHCRFCCARHQGFANKEDIKGDPNGLVMESTYCSPAIRNIVAAEGGERTVVHVIIDVRGDIFLKVCVDGGRIKQVNLISSKPSLIPENFACGVKCSLDMDEKCPLIGWKGTPVISLSAWKFY